jgi:hypothetical protein
MTDETMIAEMARKLRLLASGNLRKASLPLLIEALDALEAAQAAAAVAEARIERLERALESVLAITQVGGIDGASLLLNVRAALNKGK